MKKEKPRKTEMNASFRRIMEFGIFSLSFSRQAKAKIAPLVCPPKIYRPAEGGTRNDSDEVKKDGGLKDAPILSLLISAAIWLSIIAAFYKP